MPQLRPPAPARRVAQNAPATPRSMAGEQRALQRQGEALGDPAGPRLVGRIARELSSESIPRRVQVRVASARCGDFRAVCVARARFLPERPQHVERDHVPGPLPDAVERRLAIEAREHALLDIAAAAKALHAFIHEIRSTLPEPVFPDRDREAGEGALALALAMKGAGDAHGQRRRGLVFERQIGEHGRASRAGRSASSGMPGGIARDARPGPAPCA